MRKPINSLLKCKGQKGQVSPEIGFDLPPIKPLSIRIVVSGHQDFVNNFVLCPRI